MDSGLPTVVKLGIYFSSSPCKMMENQTGCTPEKGLVH